ncbi:MerR family transcriptional regulator [Histidinibacterium aquaticum]|uniref:MerR family transcriptional regulator n=1 Tax=Histidinibacterium aquaticum TaxID=2613962 RepID=UPI001CC7F9CC|nr:MerR family transcriptional regulator [Histidinibacterium aquaticum]
MPPKSRDAFRTISEVAEWLDTPAHVLRFWESKFPQIKPVKRAGGRRYYRPDDMALLAGIKTLLHEQGLTIKGAQKLLREKGVRHVASLGMAEGEVTDAAEAEPQPDNVVPLELPETPPAPEEAPEPEAAEAPAAAEEAPPEFEPLPEEPPETPEDPPSPPLSDEGTQEGPRVIPHPDPEHETGQPQLPFGTRRPEAEDAPVEAAEAAPTGEAEAPAPVQPATAEPEPGLLAYLAHADRLAADPDRLARVTSRLEALAERLRQEPGREASRG